MKLPAAAQSESKKAHSSLTDFVLQDGCYYIRYTPIEASSEVLFYEGTMRVLHLNAKGEPKPKELVSAEAGIYEANAGGDLYCRLREFPYGRDLAQRYKEAKSWDTAKWPRPAALPPLVKRNKGIIPIFPRQDYRYYLEVTNILEGVPGPDDVTLRFNVHTFEQNAPWPNPGVRSICLARVDRLADGAKYPVDSVYFTANVIDEDSGQIVGTLTMGWISSDLRRATVEFARISGAKFPGSKEEWIGAFKEAGWAIDPKQRKKVLAEPADGGGSSTSGAGDVRTWTIGELHQALVALSIRNTDPTELDPLDKEWFYRLLCVEKIDGFDRGVTFDTYGSDSDNVPREGSAVAALWVFGEEAVRFLNEEGNENATPEVQAEAKRLDARWGVAEGKKLQEVPNAYFRVAVHETGHAMGLDHNHKDTGFMDTTDAIADEGLLGQQKERQARVDALSARLEAKTLVTIAELPNPGPSEPGSPAQLATEEAGIKFGIPPAALKQTIKEAQELQKSATERAENLADAAKRLAAVPFPENIRLHFHPDDLNRLRFGPDVTVRPGTTFDDYGPLFGDNKITRVEGEGLRLEVSPLLESVPLGAPVRIVMRLKNNSDRAQQIPRSLSLKDGVVDGRVIDPDGNERTFWPLKKRIDGDQYDTLAPDKAATTFAMTLLRGAQKALFPMAGDHRVIVRATWERGIDKVSLEGETTVHVSPAVDESHRAAALKVISTPDTLLSLAIGGDQFKEGNTAIEAALGHPILKPHFAVVEAKRLLMKDPLEENTDTQKSLRAYDDCELIDDTTVLSFDEIERIYEWLKKTHELLSKDKKSDAAAVQKKTALHGALKTAAGVLVKKTDKLFWQGSVGPKKATELKTKIVAVFDLSPP